MNNKHNSNIIITPFKPYPCMKLTIYSKRCVKVHITDPNFLHKPCSKFRILFAVGKSTLRNANCRISKECILWNFTCGISLQNKMYFAEIKLWKNVLVVVLLSYVN